MNKQIQNGTYNRAREPQGVFLLQPSLLTQSPDWFEKPNSPLINTREKKKDYPLTEDNVFFFFSWSSIIDLLSSTHKAVADGNQRRVGKVRERKQNTKLLQELLFLCGEDNIIIISSGSRWQSAMQILCGYVCPGMKYGLFLLEGRKKQSERD